MIHTSVVDGKIKLQKNWNLSICWITFKVQVGALHAAVVENTALILPNNEICEQQNQLAIGTLVPCDSGMTAMKAND